MLINHPRFHQDSRKINTGDKFQGLFDPKRPYSFSGARARVAVEKKKGNYPRRSSKSVAHS